MSTAQGSKTGRSFPIVAVALGLLGVAFAVGLSVAIYLLVRPRGAHVGALSLTDPKASLSVSGAAGDSVVFRTDVAVAMPRLTLVSDDRLEQQVDDQLRKSALTVRATTAGGIEHTATCSVYNGRSMSTFTTSGTLSQSGMLNDCTIRLDRPGPWQLRASVTWAPDLALKSASLETRLDSGGR